MIAGGRTIVAIPLGSLQGIRNGNELKAFVPGGGSAPWFTPDQLDGWTRRAMANSPFRDAQLDAVTPLPPMQ